MELFSQDAHAPLRPRTGVHRHASSSDKYRTPSNYDFTRRPDIAARAGLGFMARIHTNHDRSHLPHRPGFVYWHSCHCHRNATRCHDRPHGRRTPREQPSASRSLLEPPPSIWTSRSTTGISTNPPGKSHRQLVLCYNAGEIGQAGAT